MNVRRPPWTSDQQESAANILEAALKTIDFLTNWGAGPDGRRRLPCSEHPLLLLGAPLGQYHCPDCGDMQIAGMSHLPPDDDYEQAMGREWPPGYADAE